MSSAEPGQGQKDGFGVVGWAAFRPQDGGNGAGPGLSRAPRHPGPTLISAQLSEREAGLWPDLAPALRAKAGATKLVCQGAPAAAPGPSP